MSSIKWFAEVPMKGTAFFAKEVSPDTRLAEVEGAIRIYAPRPEWIQAVPAGGEPGNFHSQLRSHRHAGARQVEAAGGLLRPWTALGDGG